MRKSVLLGAAALVAVGSAAYLACSGQSRRYMPNEATQKLIASEDFSGSFLEYDWSLNER